MFINSNILNLFSGYGGNNIKLTSNFLNNFIGIPFHILFRSNYFKKYFFQEINIYLIQWFVVL